MPWTALVNRNDTPPISRGGWLDALRFIVASLIILHHFQAAGPVPLAEAINPIFERAGFLLTNFFLIDSGYVLMRIYGRSMIEGRLAPGDFFLKRSLRVWPAHLLISLLLIVFVVGAGWFGFAPRNPEWFRWDQLPAQVTLTQAFGVYGGLGWNAPSWSISALIGCYLAFPFILRGLSRPAPLTILMGMIAIYLLANALTHALLGYPVYQMPMKFGFWRALPLFVLGMGLAVLSERLWINPWLARITGLSAGVALLLLQLSDKHALASLVLICLIILAAGALPVLRPSRLIEKLAVVSFVMFITNEPVRIIWFGVVNVLIERLDLAVPVQWGLWGLGLMAAFGFAFAFHVLIDQPMQVGIKRWLSRRSDRSSGVKIGNAAVLKP
jgi:peptidoglycan/LPS O-acetylase OafA/YrhL